MKLLRILMILSAFLLQAGLASNVLVGKINQSDALIAIVQTGREILAYVCGGPNDWETHTSWFQGELEPDDSFNLTSDSGLTLSGTLHNQAAKGYLKLVDGSATSWQVLEALPESSAGLYRLAESNAVTGFIVNNDLASVGSIRLIKPQAVEVLPVRAEGSLSATAVRAVSVCFTDQGETTCADVPRFE